MKSIALSAAVLCAIPAFGFAQQSQQEKRPDPALASAATPEPMRWARADQSGNQFEIQISQLAQQRTQSPQVKNLATHIEQDHQKAQQALQLACKDSNETLSTGTELNPVEQAMYDGLEKKHGEDFDRSYVFGLVGDHEFALLNYRWQAEHAPDANLRKYANDEIPVLEDHLKMARAAAEMYLNEPRQAGAEMKGTNSLNNAASAGHDSHNYSSQPNNQGAGAPGGTGTDRTIHR